MYYHNHMQQMHIVFHQETLLITAQCSYHRKYFFCLPKPQNKIIVIGFIFLRIMVIHLLVDLLLLSRSLDLTHDGRFVAMFIHFRFCILDFGCWVYHSGLRCSWQRGQVFLYGVGLVEEYITSQLIVDGCNNDHLDWCIKKIFVHKLASLLYV